MANRKTLGEQKPQEIIKRVVRVTQPEKIILFGSEDRASPAPSCIQSRLFWQVPTFPYPMAGIISLCPSVPVCLVGLFQYEEIKQHPLVLRDPKDWTHFYNASALNRAIAPVFKL